MQVLPDVMKGPVDQHTFKNMPRRSEGQQSAHVIKIRDNICLCTSGEMNHVDVFTWRSTRAGTDRVGIGLEVYRGDTMLDCWSRMDRQSPRFLPKLIAFLHVFLLVGGT